ncbi:hypothetical protein ABIA35_003668 [Catenulispora sp. MAP12-49]
MPQVNTAVATPAHPTEDCMSEKTAPTSNAAWRHAALRDSGHRLKAEWISPSEADMDASLAAPPMIPVPR